ncbi:MAG: hypothetical protein HOY69_17725 [Streptomyces sp.]|nr:hypothetical protein [Streptomyces sp.]
MTITDDIVKSLRNPTPLYAVAGTADLAAEKLREVPALIERIREQAPGRFEKIRATDPKAVQEKVAAGAKDAQAKVASGAKDAQARLTETYRDFDIKAFREKPDFKKLGESVQDLAMQGVGRATGYAVKARETYDGLAERGKGAVAHWRGEDGGDGEGGGDAEVREIGSAAEAAPKSAPARKSSPARKTAARKTGPAGKAEKADKE